MKSTYFPFVLFKAAVLSLRHQKTDGCLVGSPLLPTTSQISQLESTPSLPSISETTQMDEVSVDTFTVTFTTTRQDSHTPTPLPNRPSTVHSVEVGQSSATPFKPNQINATSGDIIRFYIRENTCAVTQSWSTSCEPTGSFVTSNTTYNTASVAQSFNFDVNVIDNQPMWFFCGGQMTTCSADTMLTVNALEEPPSTPTSTKAIQAPAGGNGTSSANAMISRRKRIGKGWTV